MTQKDQKDAKNVEIVGVFKLILPVSVVMENMKIMKLYMNLKMKEKWKTKKLEMHLFPLLKIMNYNN